MTARHSIASVGSDKPSKPEKPSPEYPLPPHPAGYWCKKIKGKIHDFGPWADPEGALKTYLEQKDELVNSFLHHKEQRVDTGELSPRSWSDYKEVCDLLATTFHEEFPGARHLVPFFAYLDDAHYCCVDATGRLHSWSHESPDDSKPQGASFDEFLLAETRHLVLRKNAVREARARSRKDWRTRAKYPGRP